jgi:hypothetical protein
MVTAKLISIDPLRKCSIQPLCLYRCLYKQALPNSEHAYSSNMYDFAGFERGKHEHKLAFNVSTYMSTVSDGRNRENVVVHKLNKYSMLKHGSFSSDL